LPCLALQSAGRATEGTAPNAPLVVCRTGTWGLAAKNSHHLPAVHSNLQTASLTDRRRWSPRPILPLSLILAHHASRQHLPYRYSGSDPAPTRDSLVISLTSTHQGLPHRPHSSSRHLPLPRLFDPSLPCFIADCDVVAAGSPLGYSTLPYILRNTKNRAE